MASLVQGLFGHRSWGAARGLLKPRRKAGRAILRGLSKRAYSFEVHDRDAVAALSETAAVYIYARAVAGTPGGAAGKDSGAGGLEFGYIGRTTNMAWQDGEHARLSHFAGHAFDVVLVLPIEEEPIRADIERDLIALYRPALNDLLRSYQPGEVS
jgi:hypothetical protein